MLGLGASAGAGHRLNLLVVFREGVEQLVAKVGRLLRLEHLQYHDLISEGALVAGVGWKSCDAVGNDPVDVADRLGGHVVCWLVVAGLDGRELLLQQRVNGVVLGMPVDIDGIGLPNSGGGLQGSDGTDLFRSTLAMNWWW